MTAAINPRILRDLEDRVLTVSGQQIQDTENFQGGKVEMHMQDLTLATRLDTLIPAAAVTLPRYSDTHRKLLQRHALIRKRACSRCTLLWKL